PEDVALCAAARRVVERVDWDCEVIRDFSDKNLGCGLRPASGIDRVFEQVGEAVILEDDCVPDPSFFTYCDELLERYRDDERVMVVGGNNYLPHPDFEYSYTFHRFMNTHGWATWRRAWRRYDFHLTSWPELRKAGRLESLLEDPRFSSFWRQIFDRLYVRSGTSDIWDFQLHYALMACGGFGVAPCVNLVSHVHSSEESTHMPPGHYLLSIPTAPMPFPLAHPPEVTWDVDYDRKVFDAVFSNPDAPPTPLPHRMRRAATATIPLGVKRWILNQRRHWA
ncbi:MAG: hypothetical protein ACREIA_07265, partial [Opitutaceae bacterium]